MKGTTFLFALLFSLLCAVSSNAQDGYKGAIGLRLGSPLSISGKLFISEKGALEAYVGSWWYSRSRYVSANLAYQIHESLEIEDFEGLRYYYGVGVGTQFWSYNNNFVNPGSNVSLGISGYIGLDYYFEDEPINISIDWTPTIFLNSILRTFGGRHGSISIRYVFSE